MPNHIHCIVSANNLSQVIKDFKSYTARNIIREVQEDNKQWLLNQLKFYKQDYKRKSAHQVWQEGFHPQAIVTEKMLKQKIQYIYYNPVRKGLVNEPANWSYSSANDCQHIDIDKLEI
ncbi:hypothetical protein JCM16358_12750 [Halanaerocella petrolearia]